VGGREESEVAQQRGADMWAQAAQCQAARFQTRFERNKNSNGSKPISNYLKVSSIQTRSSCFEKFEVKYGWREFEIRNSFPYKRFLGFQMDFEQKFR
jgi:hypothetical protein